MWSSMKAVIYILIFVFAVYCGYLFVVPQYKYYSFKSDASDIVEFNLRKSSDIKAKLLQRALDLGIKVRRRDIIVERDGKSYNAIIRWSETVDILGLYQKTYHFLVAVGKGVRAEKADGIDGGMGRGRKLFL